MRRFVIAGALLLAACATPREACIQNARQNLHVVDSLIATTKANIERGYALESQDYIDTEQQVCGKLNGQKVYCDVAVVKTREVPVAIDLNAEQAKLASLVAKRKELAARAKSAAAECARRYPDG